MALTEAAKKAQKKYNAKTITIAASFKPGTDLTEGQRVKAYLEQTGQSANSYIKALIKRDLDEKGIADNGLVETAKIVDKDMPDQGKKK